MRFVDQTTGDEVETAEVAERVAASVAELQSRLAEAKRFEARLRGRQLVSGDRFLDFSGPLEHGFDRTGPSEVKAERD